MREPASRPLRSIAPRYASRGRVGAPAAGKQLSYNNINDTDAAYECIAEFDAMRTAACVIVKHANPCGVAEGASLLEAYRKGSRVRSHLGVRRHRGAEPAARRRGARRHNGDFHRGDHRRRRPARTPIAIVSAKKNLRLLLAGALARSARTRLTVKSVAGDCS